MKQKEKDLFKSLCSFKSEKFDERLLSYATPTVLGQLFFNRMQAVAYGNLKDRGLLGKVNREFRNSLKCAYEQNVEKNESYFWCVQYIQNILSGSSCRYAMLKGAYLFKKYPDGYRTSNDIDLLVTPKSVTEIGRILINNGFKQGNVRNGKFEPATRKEIIESKMMRGETVPYIKEIKLPGMRFLEVDINFSLDYKPDSSAILEEMIDRATIIKEYDLKIKTLKSNDFFIHLCAHLYKEATTFPWVEMKRDMSLYKYCDIYMLLNNISQKELDLLFLRAKMVDMEKICAFAVLQMSQLFNFDNEYAVMVAEEILKEEPEFVHTVISPKDKKEYIFKEKNIEKRFFSENRKKLLEEAKENEKT